MKNRRFKQIYLEDGVSSLCANFGYKNLHSVPRVKKIVVNMGVGEAVTNSKVVDSAIKELALISGQKPFITKAKKLVEFFKNHNCDVIIALTHMRNYNDK